MRPAKLVLMLPVCFIGFLFVMLAFTELNKAFWDARVRYLCANEGGVTVFETVDLSAPEYFNVLKDANGIPLIPSESRANSDVQFYRTTSRFIENKIGGVVIVKSIYEIVRSSDSKVLSVSATYSRLDGDFTTLGSPGSSFSCTDIPSFQFDAEKQVFN